MKKADLSKLSRSYSVELANLGAWPNPCPPTSEAESHAALSHFAGCVNSSFDGVRGLFTLGVITLGGEMSVAVGYDEGAVSESEAAVFVRAFEGGLRRVVEESEGRSKVTVGEVRSA